MSGLPLGIRLRPLYGRLSRTWAAPAWISFMLALRSNLPNRLRRQFDREADADAVFGPSLDDYVGIPVVHVAEWCAGGRPNVSGWIASRHPERPVLLPTRRHAPDFVAGLVGQELDGCVQRRGRVLAAGANKAEAVRGYIQLGQLPYIPPFITWIASKITPPSSEAERVYICQHTMFSDWLDFCKVPTPAEIRSGIQLGPAATAESRARLEAETTKAWDAYCNLHPGECAEYKAAAGCPNAAAFFGADVAGILGCGEEEIPIGSRPVPLGIWIALAAVGAVLLLR